MVDKDVMTVTEGVGVVSVAGSAFTSSWTEIRTRRSYESKREKFGRYERISCIGSGNTYGLQRGQQWPELIRMRSAS
jgi:hypothetical protein